MVDPMFSGSEYIFTYLGNKNNSLIRPIVLFAY